jgi:hypothetical protein
MSTDQCRCEAHNGQQHLDDLIALAVEHAEQIRKAQDARRMALMLIKLVEKWQFRCYLRDQPKPPMLCVLEALAYWLTDVLRFAHSAPGILIGPVPPATGLPACPPNAGAIWWGRSTYIKPRLKAGITVGQYK